MIDTEKEPKDAERAAGEIVLLVGLSLAIPAAIGLFTAGMAGYAIGLAIGAMLALPAGLARKILHRKRVGNEIYS